MWILLVLLTAAFTALREAVIKKVMGPGAATRVMFAVHGVATVALVPFAVSTRAGLPDAPFWIALLVSGGINALASLLIARSLFRSDLSLVVPLQSFTPAFMLITAPLILGERPAVPGALGVLTIALGAYALNADHVRAGWLAPARALLSDAGARMMLVVAMLYAVSGAVDKVGVRASNPFLWSLSLNAFVALALGVRVLLTRRDRTRGARGNGSSSASANAAWAQRARAPLVIAGLALAIAVACQMTALTLTQAAYVIAVKRTSVLMGVLLGGAVFGERAIATRLAGATLMLAGVALIALSG